MGKMGRAETKIRKALNENCACYVLITCTQPGMDGNMHVEMHYEGDESLAAMLVENAGQVFDKFPNQRESQ